jgi:hypothetical protein
MTEYKIKNFDEIDFVNIDVLNDKFVLPNGKVFIFSDYLCDLCDTPGTVLEGENKSGEYHCILCHNELNWYTFTNDFLPPLGDKLKFLLPKSWSGKTFEDWFSKFKMRRLDQEKLKNLIKEYGK